MIPDFQNTTMLKGGDMEDPKNLDTTGLALNITFDWSVASYFEGVSQDGFYILVDSMFPTIASTIPSGADAILTIGSTHHKEITNCYPKNKLPKLKLFDHYDPKGELYQMEIDLDTSTLGCSTAMLTNMPQYGNGTPPCGFEFLEFLKKFYAGEFESMMGAQPSGIKGVKKVRANNFLLKVLGS